MEIIKISKSFGSLDVIKDFSLQVKDGEVVCLLGPSGCGKSTLLKILSGLDIAFEGQLDGFENKRVSYVFQESRLLPWLTVKGNLHYVLEGHVLETEIHEHVDAFLEKVGLIEFKDSYPNTLSGGMKQRVSLARAFSMPHDILLLDEPFQGLNIELKDQLMKLLENLIEQDQKTVIMVTHNLEEAYRLGDKVVKLIGCPITDFEIIKEKSE